MQRPGKGLIFKIGMILLSLLFVKLIMISVGMYTAENLKDDAKAINFAGSERMRSFKFTFLVSRLIHEKDANESLRIKKEIYTELDRFEEILRYLREGGGGKEVNQYIEPKFLSIMIELYPSSNYLLGLPGVYEPSLKDQIEVLTGDWRNKIKPLIQKVIDEENPDEAEKIQALLNESVPQFVEEVNSFVSLLEDSFDRKVNLFRSLQYIFLIITLIITAIALDHIFLHTKKSVDALMEGIRAMTGGMFYKRVAVVTNDEMGELANGFNYMAEKMEELYGNLEGKVKEKTLELEERNRTLSILYDTVASLKRTLPMEELLNGFLEKMTAALDISGGAIRLYEEDGSCRLVSSIGLDDCIKDNILFTNGFCGKVIDDRHEGSWVVTCRDDDPSMIDCLNCDYRAVAEISITYQDRYLGIINLFLDGPREFTLQEKRLVETLNNHLAASIEYYALNNKTKKLAIMEERNMLANELHDSIAQALAYLKIQGKLLEESLLSQNLNQAIKDLQQMRRGIEESNGNVRELLVHFRTKIEVEGLENTIKKFLVRFKEESGINTYFKGSADIPILAPDAEIHVLHIIQEALTNARKYSGATRVKVILVGGGGFSVYVEDNGKGFDLEEVMKKGPSHVGMDIMRERALRLGATLSIKSKPGSGTTINLQMS